LNLCGCFLWSRQPFFLQAHWSNLYRLKSFRTGARSLPAGKDALAFVSTLSGAVRSIGPSVATEPGGGNCSGCSVVVKTMAAASGCFLTCSLPPAVVVLEAVGVTPSLLSDVFPERRRLLLTLCGRMSRRLTFVLLTATVFRKARTKSRPPAADRVTE